MTAASTAGPASATGALQRPFVAALVVWVLVLCFVPDPRPLAAPDWIVASVRAVAGLSEPSARVVATLVFRVGGIALLGVLVMLASGGRHWDRRSVAAIALAPVLAVATLWVNFGYFPIRLQLQLAVTGAVLGAVAGLGLRKNKVAAIAVAVATGGLFTYGASTGIRDDLDAATRAIARHVLDEAAKVQDGDAGFVRLTELAFGFAADASVDGDPASANRAAVLALAVILGEERVAGVAGRRIDRKRLPEAEALRARITLHGRKDWSQHFWVSAGLTVLADSARSIAVGVTKEMMDSTSGGTGFSFADLAADAAGNRFALAATRDAAAARALQATVRDGAQVADFCPDLRDLPEGLTADVLQERFGGLGGDETKRVVADIERRLATCALLR